MPDLDLDASVIFWQSRTMPEWGAMPCSSSWQPWEFESPFVIKNWTLSFGILKNSRLQKVKGGNRCISISDYMFRCFGIFLLKKCSSPPICSSIYPLLLTETAHSTISPVILMSVLLRYFFFSFCSAAFLREWNQNKLENRSKCCNSASNRYRCDVCSGYRRRICPSVTIFGWLSLHKETEATGTD